jgi:hypothetical protein
LRYGRELVLFIGSQNGSYRTRARSLYLLLLARLATDGQPIKPASRTAHEYSQLFTKKLSKKRKNTEELKEENADMLHFKKFADIYSSLRWREFSSEDEANDFFRQLKQEYLNILNATRQRGLHRLVIRIISLRGLAYL